MDESQHFYSLRGHTVDEDIVGVDHGLTSAGLAAGAMRVGMVGQIIRRVADGGV